MPDTQGAMEQRRDPFGQLVFVLAEVSFDTLKSLSDLLYTGVAAVSSVKSKRDLERLLSFDLVITTDHLLHKEISGICNNNSQKPANASDRYSGQPRTNKDTVVQRKSDNNEKSKIQAIDSKVKTPEAKNNTTAVDKIDEIKLDKQTKKVADRNVKKLVAKKPTKAIEKNNSVKETSLQNFLSWLNSSTMQPGETSDDQTKERKVSPLVKKAKKRKSPETDEKIKATLTKLSDDDDDPASWVTVKKANKKKTPFVTIASVTSEETANSPRIPQEESCTISPVPKNDDSTAINSEAGGNAETSPDTVLLRDGEKQLERGADFIVEDELERDTNFVTKDDPLSQKIKDILSEMPRIEVKKPSTTPKNIHKEITTEKPDILQEFLEEPVDQSMTFQQPQEPIRQQTTQQSVPSTKKNCITEGDWKVVDPKYVDLSQPLGQSVQLLVKQSVQQPQPTPAQQPMQVPVQQLPAMEQPVPEIEQKSTFASNWKVVDERIMNLIKENDKIVGKQPLAEAESKRKISTNAKKKSSKLTDPNGEAKRTISILGKAPKNYECKPCNLIGMNRKDFNEHHFEKHMAKQPAKPEQLAPAESVFRVQQVVNFVCKHCSYKFKTREALQKHEMIHTDEKPFTCNTCGKGFRVQSNLDIHVRSHGMVITRSENSAVPQLQYKCQMCSFTTPSKTDMSVHIRCTHAKEKAVDNGTFECRACNLKGMTRDGWNKHNNETHFQAAPQSQTKRIFRMNYQDEQRLSELERLELKKQRVLTQNAKKELQEDNVTFIGGT